MKNHFVWVLPSPYASPLLKSQIYKEAKFFLNTNRDHFSQSNNMLVKVVLHGTIRNDDF